MLKSFSNLSNNRIIKNFMKLFSATLFAQLITIALSPIQTRLYSPEDFGYYSVFATIVSLAVVYATGRYEYAISTTKTIEESETLFKLVVFLSCASSLLIFIIILIFEDIFNQLAGFKANSHILYYLPIAIIVIGIMQGLMYYFNRKKDFSYISKSKVLQSATNGGSSVIFAYFGFHTLGMVWAHILGVLITNFYYIFGRKMKSLFKNYKFNEIKKIAITYKQYPLYNSTSSFFDVMALQAPILIFNRFFSEIVVGFYSLTVRVIASPISLVSTAVAQVYLSELPEKENNGERIDLLLKKVLILLAIIGLLPMVILVFFGPWLFGVVFGDKWNEAGKLAQILSLAYYAKFVISPLNVVFFVKNDVKTLSFIQFGRAVSTVFILIISSYLVSSFYKVVLIFSIYEVLFYIFFLLLILKKVKYRKY